MESLEETIKEAIPDLVDFSVVTIKKKTIKKITPVLADSSVDSLAVKMKMKKSKKRKKIAQFLE